MSNARAGKPYGRSACGTSAIMLSEFFIQLPLAAVLYLLAVSQESPADESAITGLGALALNPKIPCVPGFTTGLVSAWELLLRQGIVTMHACRSPGLDLERHDGFCAAMTRTA